MRPRFAGFRAAREPDSRAAYPEVPWREIIGMRSVISHGCDQIDDDELWQVIERDLPGLMPKLEAILARLNAAKNLAKCRAWGVSMTEAWMMAAFAGSDVASRGDGRDDPRGQEARA